MASPSSFKGNARPAHVTALSGKVNNLRFMQRANAAQQQQQQPAASPSSTTNNAAKATSDKTATSPVVHENRSAIEESIPSASVDGNDEHWSLTPSGPSTSEHDEDGAVAQGWNSWLLASSSRSDTTGSSGHAKRGTKRGEEEDGDDGAGISSMAPLGKRTFGKFATDGQDAEDEDDDGAQGDSRRRRSRRSQRESMSPEVEFDSQGQLKVRRQKQGESPRVPTTMREKKAQADSQKAKPKQRGFIKPGSMGNESRSRNLDPGHESDDLEFGPEDLDESFADHDDADGGDSSVASRKKSKSQKRKAKKRKSN